MSVSIEDPRIEADPKAVEFIRSHGGTLYVWISDAGLEHETTRPKAGVGFSEYRGNGFGLQVDRGIEAARHWRLVYHSFPRPHVRALWNGAAFSPGGARMPRWEGGSPFKRE